MREGLKAAQQLEAGKRDAIQQCLVEHLGPIHALAQGIRAGYTREQSIVFTLRATSSARLSSESLTCGALPGSPATISPMSPGSG